MTKPREKAYSIAVEALHDKAQEGWPVRWKIVKGMAEAIFGSFALAWIFLAVGGIFVLFPVSLYFDWSGSDFLVFALVAGLLILGYVASSLQREVTILHKAMREVADTLGEGDTRHE